LATPQTNPLSNYPHFGESVHAFGNDNSQPVRGLGRDSAR